MFGNEGYSVAVCDPTLAGYGWIPDLSVFDGVPNTEAYITIGNNAIENMELYASIDKSLNRNFFCYSVFKTSPFLLRTLLYNDGIYNAASLANLSNDKTEQLKQKEQQTKIKETTQTVDDGDLNTDITAQVKTKLGLK